MPKTPVLSEEAITTRLQSVPDWAVREGALSRTYRFADFAAALRFVNAVGEAAEAANHHPDIDIRYNTVTLSLVTHDSGGITDKDFVLAASADRLATPA